MRNLTVGVLCLLAMTQACSESTAPRPNALGARVSYRLSSMFPISRAMTISPNGVVQAELIDEGSGSSTKFPWVQLSASEIDELKILLEPFSGFDPYYHDPNAPADGPAVSIAVEQDGVKREVGVYPAYNALVPPELVALGVRLGELFLRAAQE